MKFFKVAYYILIQVFFVPQLVMSQAPVATKEKVNIFIFDSPQHKKILSQTVWWRAKWHAVFSKGRMVAIRAKSPMDAAFRVEKIIKKKNRPIGLLWFDSHGYYYNRQSTFYIGKSRINYHTIANPEILIPLQKIAALCNNHTRVTLGACFTAATYFFPNKDTLQGRRMNGDSLLLAVGSIFKNCTIYGCQSWVMESPGIWRGGYKLAGAPLQRMYKDEIFKPAWENIGQWTKYNPEKKQLENCAPIALNKKGDLFEKTKNYQSRKSVAKRINRNLHKLKPDLYKKELRVEL